jgi:hypothetical protein
VLDVSELGVQNGVDAFTFKQGRALLLLWCGTNGCSCPPLHTSCKWAGCSVSKWVGLLCLYTYHRHSLALPRPPPWDLGPLGSPSPLGGSDAPPSPWRPAGVAASGHRRRAAQAEGGAPSRDRAAEEGGGAASRDRVVARRRSEGSHRWLQRRRRMEEGPQRRHVVVRCTRAIQVSYTGAIHNLVVLRWLRWQPYLVNLRTYTAETSSSSDGPHRVVAPSGKGKEVIVGWQCTRREGR